MTFETNVIAVDVDEEENSTDLVNFDGQAVPSERGFVEDGILGGALLKSSAANGAVFRYHSDISEIKS